MSVPLSILPSVSTVDRLWAWAWGVYPLEAAVELLLRAQHGRFADDAYPWIGSDGVHAWLEPDEITEDTIGALSGGERRLLRIVGSLAGGPSVSLCDNLPGLDRASVRLVLAAIAHAAGTHEHADPDGQQLGSLYPWPE
jgi:hypothetical protein